MQCVFVCILSSFGCRHIPSEQISASKKIYENTWPGLSMKNQTVTIDALRAITWNVTCSFNVRQSISRWRQVRRRVAPHVVSRFPVFKFYFSYRKEPVHLSHKVSSPEVRRMPLFWRIQPKRRTIWYVNKTQLKLACKSQNSRSKNVS